MPSGPRQEPCRGHFTMSSSRFFLTVVAVVTYMAAAAAAGVVGAPSAEASVLRDHEVRVAVNNKFDHIFANMRQAIIESGLDPLPLASDEDFFTVTLFNRTMNGTVWVEDGAVRGLSTIHRTGNMSLEYGVLDEEVIVSGEVGLTGLQVTYATGTEVGWRRSHIKATFGFPYLSVIFRTNVFVNQADIELEYCYIEDFSYSHIQLDGVGLRDEPFYELFVNALLQIVNDNVASVVEDEVCSLIQQAVTGSASR